MRFTSQDLEKKLAAGTIRGYEVKQVEKKVKRAKYNNQKVKYDGIVFDSKKEYHRYRELLLLLKAGEIGQLRRQVVYKLSVPRGDICKYVADFVYIVVATGETIVEDVKSDMTRKLPAYRLKKKMMKAILNIEIKEV